MFSLFVKMLSLPFIGSSTSFDVGLDIGDIEG